MSCDHRPNIKYSNHIVHKCCVQIVQLLWVGQYGQWIKDLFLLFQNTMTLSYFRISFFLVSYILLHGWVRLKLWLILHATTYISGYVDNLNYLLYHLQFFSSRYLLIYDKYTLKKWKKIKFSINCSA